MEKHTQKAYRETIRRVLVKATGVYHDTHTADGLLRLMDDIFGFVDKDHPRDRAWLDPEAAGQVLLFMSWQPITATGRAEHFIWVKVLYEVYLHWVGPKKFRTLARREFQSLVSEMFGWTLGKAKGRIAFLGVKISR